MLLCIRSSFDLFVARNSDVGSDQGGERFLWPENFKSRCFCACDLSLNISVHVKPVCKPSYGNEDA